MFSKLVPPLILLLSLLLERVIINWALLGLIPGDRIVLSVRLKKQRRRITLPSSIILQNHFLQKRIGTQMDLLMEKKFTLAPTLRVRARRLISQTANPLMPGRPMLIRIESLIFL